MKIVVEHPKSGNVWVGGEIPPGVTFDEVEAFVKNISEGPNYFKMSIGNNVLFFQQSLIRECLITIQK